MYEPEDEDARSWNERLMAWFLHTNMGVLTFVGVQFGALLVLALLVR